MKLKEIIEQLKSYQDHNQVIAMTETGKIISTTFDLYTCPIHSNMFSVFGNIDEKKHAHIINKKTVLNAFDRIPINSTIRGCKGQEIDHVDADDRILLFTNNLKSIYCGTYKYLSPYHIFKDQTDKIIILCEGN